MCVILTEHLVRLATSPLVKSHTWLVVTVLDTTGNLYPDFLMFCALDLYCLFSFMLCCHEDFSHSPGSGFFFSIWQISQSAVAVPIFIFIHLFPTSRNHLMILLASVTLMFQCGHSDNNQHFPRACQALCNLL